MNIITGQYDLVCSTPGTFKWVETLVETEWEDIKGSNTDKKRGIIIINDFLEGYYMKYKQLTMYTVLNAGHALVVENEPTMNWILKKILKIDSQSNP